MDYYMKKDEKIKEVAVIPEVKKDLILEGDPEAQLAFAGKAAKALMKVAKPINIQGKEYLPFGSWQILGRFFGSTVGVEWTKKIAEGPKLLGYEARAVVYRSGEVISSAEASCMKTERNWSNRDEYAIKSMAQTRACAKALRNAFGWVAEMGGYAATPFEEMDGIVPDKPRMAPYQVTPIKYPKFDETKDVAPLSEKQAVNEEIADMQKEGIKDMLTQLKKPNSKKVVQELTGLTMEEKNFDSIYKILKKKVEATDPISSLEIE